LQPKTMPAPPSTQIPPPKPGALPVREHVMSKAPAYHSDMIAEQGTPLPPVKEKIGTVGLYDKTRSVRSSLTPEIRDQSTPAPETIDLNSSSEFPHESESATKSGPDGKASSVSDGCNKSESASEEEPIASCRACNIQIPNSTFHFRCVSCIYPGDEHKCQCQICYKEDDICPEHKEPLQTVCVKSRLGFHHYVLYVDPAVSKFDTSVTKAIKLNDLDGLRRVARNKTLLNAYNNIGSLPLHLAAQLGRADCARVLLESGAPKEARERTDDRHFWQPSIMIN